MAKKKDGKKSKKKDLEPVAPADLAASLTQAARSLRTALSRSLAESGLYAGQDGVILALAEEDGLTTGQLAAHLGVKAPTMTRTIGRMEVQGFVARAEDEEDGRLTKVFLTDSGRASVARIEAGIAACGELALKDFSGKEIRTLMRLLRALDHNLHASE